MYKKIWIVLLFLIFLCSCSADTSPNTSQYDNSQSCSTDTASISSQYDDSQYCLDNIDVICKQDKNYTILSNEEATIFYYSIKDNNGDIIDAGYHNYRGSFDIYKNGKFLTLDYGYGGNAWHARYYDLSNGRISRFFERPIQISNELVAYFTLRDLDNAIVLVIQNMFDPNTYYKEIVRDFSDFVFKDEVEAEFLENDTKLKISYWIKPDNQKITEIIDFSECALTTDQTTGFNTQYDYEVENNTIKIISHHYDPQEPQIIVPEEIDGKPVSILEADAFYQHQNTSAIILPQNLKMIKGGPFYRCYSLKEISIPSNVQQIDANPFFRCSSLTKITVEPSNAYYSDLDGVLFDKEKTQLIAYPEGKTLETYVVPKTVKKLNIDSFGYHTMIKELTILSNVTDFPDGNMFVYPNDITLVVEPGSAAEQYAKEYNLNYEILTQSTGDN